VAAAIRPAAAIAVGRNLQVDAKVMMEDSSGKGQEKCKLLAGKNRFGTARPAPLKVRATELLDEV
jgi:hypothetical protein